MKIQYICNHNKKQKDKKISVYQSSPSFISLQLVFKDLDKVNLAAD